MSDNNPSKTDLMAALDNMYKDLADLHTALGNELDKMKRQAADRQFTEEEKEQRKQLRSARKNLIQGINEVTYRKLIVLDNSDEIKSLIKKFKKINNQLHDDREDIKDFLDVTEQVAKVAASIVSMIELAAKLRPTL